MKRILVFFVLSFLCSQIYAQEFIYKGTIIESGANSPIQGAKIQIGNVVLATSATDGSFEFSAVSGKQYFSVVAVGYLSYEAEIEFGSNTDLGIIRLRRSFDVNEEMDYITEVELDDNMSSSQSTSALLSSSQDVFSSMTGYNLRTFRFNERGYESNTSLVYVNGIKMNDAERGMPVYAIWGGLNDAFRNQMHGNGLAPSDESFGALGGVTNLNTRASNFRKQIKVAYAASNEQYRHRLMVTAGTGMMQNNWALAFSASRRVGAEGYVQGTSYDAWSYFFSAEKKINSQHSIALSVFAAPNERGIFSGTVQEVYDLMGNNYHNPNWGWQNGEKRNSRVRKSHQPVLTLNHYWKINENTNLTTSFGYSFGRDGQQALTWGEGSDPRPDYYRNLPSYFSSAAIKELVGEKFKSDPSVNQVNWSSLYQQNMSDADEHGKYAAKYFIEDRRNDRNQMSFNTVLMTKISENATLQVGAEARNTQTKYFKVIKDLLGADYWLDIDKYAKRDKPTDEDYFQSNLNNPNQKVKEGDRFGYDYTITQTEMSLWALLRMKFDKVDVYAGPQLSNTSYYRKGFMQTGTFPDNSLGKAQTLNFGDYALKSGFTYKVTGRHFVDGNIAYMTRAPFYRNVYLAPRTRDNVIKNPTSEKIFSSDLSYIMRTPYIQARVTGYYTTIQDGVETYSSYDDSYGTFVNTNVNGLDRRHIGIEAGLKLKLSQTTTLETAIAHGKYTYTSNPNITVYQDATAEELIPTETSYVKGFYVAGTPQTAIAAKITYNSPKYWWVSLGGNYAANAYLDFSYIKRVLSLYKNASDVDYDAIKEYTKETRLPEAFTFDFSGGYSVRLKSNYLLFMLSVQNLMNTKNIKTGGYEQARINLSDLTSATFSPKYFYAYGTTFFFQVSYRF